MYIIRQINRNWQWVLINVIGLSLAFACAVLVFTHSKQEFSYDRFHQKADRIYRATTSTEGFSEMHPARFWGEWVPNLKESFSSIEEIVRLIPYKKAVVEIETNRFYSRNIFKVDNAFFDLFDFELVAGDRSTLLTNPKEAVITKSIALKYFGQLDVLGKSISIMHQQLDSAAEFTVVGIMDDFPVHSHFHAEILTSLPDTETSRSWGYTYYLLQEGTPVENLRQNIQVTIDELQHEDHPRRHLHLQPLTDIHLYSHKTREMETNGDIRSVILLISGALIILFIGFINFLNLSRVQFIAGTKSIKIKMIHGASRKDIAMEIMLGSLFISISAICMGLFLAHKLGTYVNLNVFTYPLTLALISLIFILLIAVLAVLPFLTSGIKSDARVAESKAGLYAFPLVVQFTLATIALICTFVLQKQINFLNNQHPQALNANMLVVERNHWNVVQRYDALKAELLKDPSITGMTGAMEEPGGQILDNFYYSYNGQEMNKENTIYVLTTDQDFLKVMGIEPLAGSVDLGYTPNQEWDGHAIALSELTQQENYDQAEADALYEKLGNYREKYILNETALKMLGIEEPEEAIGKAFQMHFQLPYLFPEGEVVAVVPDFHYTNMRNEERPLVIAPRRMFNYSFFVRIDPKRRSEAIAYLNDTWQKVNPEYPLEYSFISDSYKKVYTTEYTQSRVLLLFACISILLSILGIYAMASFSMQRRTKEIGIRKVNGASIREIIIMLNAKFLLWVSVALVLAIPIAWYAMTRWLEGFAYKTTLNWWIFLLAGAIAILVAMITVSGLAYRAASKNPVKSIRYE